MSTSISSGTTAKARLAADLLATSMKVVDIKLAFIKAYKSIEDYGRRLRGLTRGLWNGEIDKFRFVDDVFSAMTRAFNQAWTEGARTQGVEPSERTPEEEAKLQELINTQATFIPGLADWVLAHAKAGIPLRPSPTAVEAPPDPFTATPAAPTAPPPTGTGETFADTISYRETKNSWEFDEAVKKMDQVIGTGQADFEVKMSGGAGITSQNRAEYNANTRKVKVKFDPSGNEMVTLHELGHAVDYQLMMDNLGLSELKIGAPTITRRVIPETDGFWEAMYNSDAVKKLQRSLDKNNDPFLSYMTDQSELWARGFAQYIAEKTQDEGLLWELGNELEDAFYQGQWTSKDFAPILKEFDKLFKAARMLL